MADWRTFFGGRYLSGPDLADADLTATVDHIEKTLVEDPEGGASKEKMIVFLRGDVKPWLPCRTTAECVAAMHGPDTDGWRGKAVTLFFDPTVKVGHEVKGGIRVRGAPGIRPMTVTVKLPRRKPIVCKLVDTSGAPKPGPRPSLAEVLETHRLTMAAADAWCTSRGKALLSASTPAQQQQAADWLATHPEGLAAILEHMPSNATPDSYGD